MISIPNEPLADRAALADAFAALREKAREAPRPDDLGARDERFIRRVLPLLGAFYDAYHRAATEMEEDLPDGPMLVVGNGPYAYPDAFADLSRDAELAGIADCTPTAIPLAELAVGRLLREDSDRLADVRPMYIRKSDAEMTWEKLGKG